MKKYIFNFLIICLLSFGSVSFVSGMQSDEQCFTESLSEPSEFEHACSNPAHTEPGRSTTTSVRADSESPALHSHAPSTNTVINIFVFMLTVKHCSLSDLLESYGESIYCSWIKLRKIYRNQRFFRFKTIRFRGKFFNK